PKPALQAPQRRPSPGSVGVHSRSPPMSGQHTSAAEPSQGANSAPAGGSAAAKPQAWGDHASATEPPQGANCAPAGGSAAAKPQAWGDHANEPLAIAHTEASMGWGGQEMRTLTEAAGFIGRGHR